MFALAHPDEGDPAGDGREAAGEGALDEHAAVASFFAMPPTVSPRIKPTRRCRRPGIAAAYRSAGQYLGPLALELLGRDDTPVTQVGQLGQLVGRAL
jgi:hypothetical protein